MGFARRLRFTPAAEAQLSQNPVAVLIVESLAVELGATFGSHQVSLTRAGITILVADSGKTVWWYNYRWYKCVTIQWWFINMALPFYLNQTAVETL